MRLFLVWGALFVNVLPYGSTATVMPLPPRVGQMIAQGSLVVAVGLVATLNPKMVLRPSLVLSLLSMLAVAGLLVSIHNEFVVGSAFRAIRAAVFLLVLWALTPWWGRSDMLLLRLHRRCLWLALVTVVLGAGLAPDRAFAFEGRLAGVLWPIWPTQVAHFAAVLLGTTAVLWSCRVVGSASAALTLVVTTAVLIGTHTRTAVLAMLLGLAVAGASLFLGHARVRRTSALVAVGTVLAVSLFATEVTTWAMRGQSTTEMGNLTGRTEVWSDVMAASRPRMSELFGIGLSDQSFRGLAIDSSWVAAYWEQGWFGVVVAAGILLLLLLMAACHERGPRRAVGLFLVVFCLISSIAETGLTVPSAFMLDLVVAAALLAPPAKVGRP